MFFHSRLRCPHLWDRCDIARKLTHRGRVPSRRPIFSKACCPKTCGIDALSSHRTKDKSTGTNRPIGNFPFFSTSGCPKLVGGPGSINNNNHPPAPTKTAEKRRHKTTATVRGGGCSSFHHRLYPATVYLHVLCKFFFSDSHVNALEM